MSADLDDFFKKRDKKKNKTQTGAKKFTKINPEEFAKQLELVTSTTNEDLADDKLVGSDYVIVDSSATVAEPLAALSLSSAPALAATAPVHQHSTVTKHSEHNGDEEWKPFETDDNKDYSGLRVNILQKWNNENEEDEDDETREDLERKPNCPWLMNKNKGETEGGEEGEELAPVETAQVEEVKETPVQQQQQQQQHQPPVEQQQSSATPVESAGGPKAYVPPHLRGQAASAPASAPAATSAPAGVVMKTYIPPSMRNQLSSGSSNSGQSGPSSSSEAFTTVSKHKGKNQPNINDIGEFPSLGDMAGPSETSKPTNESKFEQPKRSVKTESSNPRGPSSIEIGNKYNALSSTSS